VSSLTLNSPHAIPLYTCCDSGFTVQCECNATNDWASFILLLIELNLVVYGTFISSGRQSNALGVSLFTLTLYVLSQADYIGSKSSGDAIKKLQEASSSQVGVKRNGEWIKLPIRELVPGDLVAVTIGMCGKEKSIYLSPAI
jgi:magnesium-transporting ATPase (P-type)